MKTNMQVDTNSATVALMESGCVASSTLPNAYARVAIILFFFSSFPSSEKIFLKVIVKMEEP